MILKKNPRPAWQYIVITFVILTAIVFIHDMLLVHPQHPHFKDHMEIVVVITITFAFMVFIAPLYRAWYLRRNPFLGEKMV